ncbi:hypothetical protein D3C75_980040 [compost metagenome]
MNHSQIYFVEAMGADALGQPGSGFGGLGKNHRPANRPVQPMDQTHIYVARFIKAFLHIFLQQAEQIGISCSILLHRNIHGLHNSEQMVIFVQDLEPGASAARIPGCTGHHS